VLTSDHTTSHQAQNDIFLVFSFSTTQTTRHTKPQPDQLPTSPPTHPTPPHSPPPIHPSGYDVYVIVTYVIAGCIFVSLVLAVWLAISLKKDDTGTTGGWMGKCVAQGSGSGTNRFFCRKPAARACSSPPLTRLDRSSPTPLRLYTTATTRLVEMLQLLTLVMWSIAWVSLLDYLVRCGGWRCGCACD